MIQTSYWLTETRTVNFMNSHQLLIRLACVIISSKRAVYRAKTKQIRLTQ
ncbi:hypothetical protein Hanom_Chr11g00970281 [Helianthus anomalus]